MRELRKWLEEKRSRGVERVSVKATLDKIAELSRTNASRRRNGRVTIGPGDLIGAYEASVLLGVDRTRPTKWRQHGTTFGPDKLMFPEPFAELRGAKAGAPPIPVFLRAEVERLKPFVEERRRKPHPDA